MLKINKTKPYQFRKVHDNSSYIGRVVCALALICGIMPGLMGLSYYGSVEKASAATLSIDNIFTMQEMRPGICYNMKIGDSATLTDIRDNNAYTIAKLSDGKCWMTQNLRIVDKEITPEDSDVTENFTIPASSISGFSGYDVANAYYGNSTTYGAYYSWYTATAGTGTQAMASGDASSSICPKGWRLPKGTPGTDTNEFAAAAGLTGADIATGSNHWGNLSNPSFTNNALTVNGVTWPAAGYYYNNTADRVGSGGYYWSSTAYSNNNTYRLYFDSSYFGPANNNSKTNGSSVRCVADSIPEENVDVIAIVVPPVISIDATSGMNKEVDPNLVTKGEISATISANTTYAVQLSANKTSLTNPNNSDEPTSANSIPASSNVQAKTNAWGILNQDNSSISPTLPAGEYSTTVTITAVNN